ncbi:MAG: hypothetical protein ACI4GC_03335 [Acutalibacteraceae bacterium]
MKQISLFKQDKKSYAVLLFFSALIVDLLSAVFGFGGAQFIFHFSDFRFYIAEFISLPMCISCFTFLSKLKKVSEDKVRKDLSVSKLSFIIIAIFVFVSILALYICNTPMSEYFNYSVFEYLIKS